MNAVQYEKMSSWLAMSQLVRSMACWYAAMSETSGGVLSESGRSGMYISRIRIGAVCVSRCETRSKKRQWKRQRQQTKTDGDVPKAHLGAWFLVNTARQERKDDVGELAVLGRQCAQNVLAALVEECHLVVTCVWVKQER